MQLPQCQLWLPCFWICTLLNLFLGNLAGVEYFGHDSLNIGKEICVFFHNRSTRVLVTYLDSCTLIFSSSLEVAIFTPKKKKQTKVITFAIALCHYVWHISKKMGMYMLYRHEREYVLHQGKCGQFTIFTWSIYVKHLSKYSYWRTPKVGKCSRGIVESYQTIDSLNRQSRPLQAANWIGPVYNRI